MVYPNPNFNSGYVPQYNYGVGQQPQIIQNMSVQPQSYCYFVKSPNDLNGINVMPNTFYLGINVENNEIYLRRMNNDGLVDVKTYSLQSEKKEQNDFQAIFERLDSIEKKLTTKGKDNERTSRTINE